MAERIPMQKCLPPFLPSWHFSNLGHITAVPSTRCVHEMLPADTATWACMSHYGPRYVFAGLSFPLRLPA